MRFVSSLMLCALLVATMGACRKTIEGPCEAVPESYAIDISSALTTEQAKFFEKNFAICKQRKFRKDPNALFSVGVSVLHGVGTQKEPSKAFLWLKGAADKKHKRAQKILAEMFMQGVGVVRDPLIARKYVAASEGLPIP